MGSKARHTNPAMSPADPKNTRCYQAALSGSETSGALYSCLRRGIVSYFYLRRQLLIRDFEFTEGNAHILFVAHPAQMSFLCT